MCTEPSSLLIKTKRLGDEPEKFHDLKTHFALFSVPHNISETVFVCFAQRPLQLCVEAPFHVGRIGMNSQCVPFVRPPRCFRALEHLLRAESLIERDKENKEYVGKA